MGIASKTKATLKEAYKSVKKSFNSFLKKLGFSKKESYEVSNSFDQQLKVILAEYDKEHQKLKEVLDKIIPENEPAPFVEKITSDDEYAWDYLDYPAALTDEEILNGSMGKNNLLLLDPDEEITQLQQLSSSNPPQKGLDEPLKPLKGSNIQNPNSDLKNKYQPIEELDKANRAAKLKDILKEFDPLSSENSKDVQNER